MRLLNLTIIVGVLMTLISCASFVGVKDLDPTVFYKPDITLKYKDYQFGGWGVLPYSKDNFYDIEIEAAGKIDLIRVSTNSRLDTDEPHSRRVFRNGKKYKYRYIPDYDLEVRLNSLITIETFEAGLPGRHSVGLYMIDYGPRGVDALPAITKCNARAKSMDGVSMCVTKEGLYQQLKFKVEVELMTNSKKSCAIVGGPKKVWLFKTRNRICEYTFLDLENGLTHAHLSVGYEDVAVRRYK